MTRRLFLAALAAQPSKPNILLILADDLGFSDLGCFGGEIATPNLDALANSGVRMTQFYNYTRCCPSRAALLSGKYPHQVGVGSMIGGPNAPARPDFPGYQPRMDAGVPMLPQALRQAGYTSLMCGKWHLGASPGPIERGFEEFYGMVHGFDSFWNPSVYTRLPAGRPVRKYERFYATEAITDHAIEFLAGARRASKPWFLYLAYNAPHFPLHAPRQVIDKYQAVYEQGWDRIRAQRLERLKRARLVNPDWLETPRSEVPPNRFFPAGSENPAWDSLDADRKKDLARRMATFAAMVEIMDQNVGRVVADLKANGDFDNTLILFFSDNGACAEWDYKGFDEVSGPKNVLHKGGELDRMGQPGTYHSYGSGWANAGNTPFRLYKHYGHEGGISTAFLAHWTGKLRPSVIHHPAHIIDVFPALEAIANGRPDTSLTATLKGRPVKRGPLFWEHEGNRAVRDGRWKLVAKGPDGQWELYDIERDRTEMRNLAAKHPSRVAAMSKMWTAWARENRVLPWPWKPQFGGG